MTLHREGTPTIVITILFIAFINALAGMFSPYSWLNNIFLVFSVFLLIIVLQFFRNPKRAIPVFDNAMVYSPADGKVVVIEETEESEYFNDKRLMISVFMSPINVHSNHHPVGGSIAYEKYHAGKYLVAWHPKSSTENERHTTVYKTDTTEILCRQIAGALARRIVNYTKKGMPVVQGEEMGFIKFGSRVDIFLPLDAKVLVSLGQVVKSRTDVLAELR